MRKLNLGRWLVFLVVLLSPALVGANPLDVKADSTYYDINTGYYMLEGNVTVHIKDAEIRAQSARASLATLEVYAEGGISVSQGNACFRGDSVYINAAQRHAYIDGNISMQDDGLSITCAKADFNWKTKDVVLTNATITDSAGQRYADQAVYNVETKSLSY